MSSPLVMVDMDAAGIATITLNSPKTLNALTVRMGGVSTFEPSSNL